MRKFLSILCVALTLGANLAQAGGKIQNEDVKSLADLITAGSDGSHLINDTKVWISANGINQQLSSAISAGLIGGSSGSGGGINTLQNPGAEVDLQHISDTISPDLVRTTTVGNVLFGQGSFGVLASAAEVVTWDAITIPNGLKGQSCAASLVYKGNASAYTMRVEDGSSNILANQVLGNASAAPQTQYLSFQCPSSGTIKLQLATTGAGAQIYFDNALLGTSPVPQFSQASLIGSISVNSCATEWQTTSATFANFSTVSSCAYVLSGNVSAPGSNIPAIVLNSGAPGDYKFVISGLLEYIGTSGQVAQFRVNDGTNASNECAVEAPTAGSGGSCVVHITESSSFSNLTVQLQALTTGGQTAGVTGSTVEPLHIAVYYYPTQAQSVFNAGQVANSWSGYHDGDCDWLSSSATFADPAFDATCSFVQRTNTNFGTVSSYNNGTPGNNLPGIVFTPSRAGKYKVCAVLNPLENSSGSVNYSAELSDLTPTTVATINTGTVTAAQPAPATLCGLYQASSTSPVTLRVRLKTGGGNVEVGAVGAGNPAIEWSIFQIDQPMPAPVLVGSVLSSSAGVEVSNRIAFGGTGSLTSPTNCTSDPCTIYSQSGSWVSSVTRVSGGVFTLNLNASTYSAPPTCVSTTLTSAATPASQCSPVSSTSVSCQCVVASTGYDCGLSVLCQGPK